MTEDNKTANEGHVEVAEDSKQATPPAAGAQAQTAAAQNVTPSYSVDDDGNVDIPEYLQDLPVQVDVLLGSVKLTVKELLTCGPGAVIDVGKRVSDSFDLYVNKVLVARGEVVTMHDRLGLKITEVLDGAPANSLR